MTKKQRDDSDDSDGALNDSSSSSSDSDESSLFPGPDKKRPKLNKNDVNGDDKIEDDESDNDNEDGHVTTTESATKKKKTVDPVLFEQAKSRLSKFAARLFDPNRIRVRTRILFQSI